MKIFAVALAFLLAGIYADQPDQISPELFDKLRFGLPEPIAYSYALDGNDLHLEDYNDVNDLTEDESLQAVPVGQNTYIIRPIISNVVKNSIDNLKKHIPNYYKMSDFSLSGKKDERSFGFYVHNVNITGLGNINIDDINVNIWGTKATITLRLPEIKLQCGRVASDYTVFDSKLSASKSGTVSVSNIVIVVNTVINPIRLTVTHVDVSIHFVGPVQSKLNVQLLGTDISRAVNDMVEKVIPSVLDENKGKLEDILQARMVSNFGLNEPLSQYTSFYL